jgi:hypothetical protein
MDPITGQGIGYALRDAELVAEAIEAGLTGREPLGAALAGYQRARDAASLPMYAFTTELASFPPPKPEQEALFAALATRPAEVDRFLGVLTGAVPLQEYFAPGNLFKVMGVRGMARVALDKLRSALSSSGAAQRAPGGGGGLPSVEASSRTGSTSVSQG